MNCLLVVVKPFLHFRRGDIISNFSEIEEILSIDQNRFVTKILSQSELKD